MADYFDFEDADAFATGAVGVPGSRTFYLQVRAQGRVVTVKCEKQQVAELARHLRTMLDDLPEEVASDPRAASLVGPVEEDFVLGSIGLGVDRSNARMVVQLEEMVVIDEGDFEEFAELLGDGDDIDTSTVRVLITPGQARAFCDAADTAVGAGRETCRWCGNPRDPSGHACPRFN